LADPILVHIGYHRTGSSWLQKYVFAKPQTGFRWTGKRNDDDPVRRLITLRWSEFDPVKLRRRFDYRFEQIRERGLIPVVSFERLSGHACSGGFDSGEIASRLHQVLPEGRILIVVREQQSAILSTYKRYVRAGGTGSLMQFVCPPTTSNLRVPLFDFRHFEYHHLIRRYQKLFGEEAVLVLTFEQFQQDPRTFVARIGQFMGRPLPEEVLDRLPYDHDEQPGLSPSEHVMLRRLNQFIRSEVNPVPLVDLELHQAMKRLVRPKDAAVGRLVPSALAERSDASLRREVVQVVSDRYAASNRRTAELTGLELARFGYAV
jgi:sulfotransferase family protein